MVGVHLTGALREGVTTTDMALTVTQMLRKAKVVLKICRVYGLSAAALPVVDRATIANMAPEYGATMGFFPIDEECVTYLRATGRSEEHCRLYENYYRAQGLFGIRNGVKSAIRVTWRLDLGTARPSVAGPKRPQDRIELPNLKHEFVTSFSRPVTENGFGKKAEDLLLRVKVETGVSGGLPIDHSYGENKARVSASESEMRDQHPTPDEAETVPAAAFPKFEALIGHGSADRGDHELHEHVESQRDARGRVEGQKSRGKGPAGQSGGEVSRWRPVRAW